MSHHKRRRPKNRRGGCLFCKPHKRNGARLADRDPLNARRRTQDGLEVLTAEATHRG